MFLSASVPRVSACGVFVGHRGRRDRSANRATRRPLNRPTHHSGFRGKARNTFIRGTRRTSNATNDNTSDLPYQHPPPPGRGGDIPDIPLATKSSEVRGNQRNPPNEIRRGHNTRYTTLAERLANNDNLRANFTIGLKWWTPLSPLNGFEGVAEACSRLWENTVLLSALITSFSMFAVTFPIKEIIDAPGSIPQIYAASWTLAFCFCATAGFGATILLNKICKCAPQNYSLWFAKFGGFVELPQLFLYFGGWCAFAGCLVVLTPIYKSNALTVIMVVVCSLCGSLVTAMYSQTTVFEKACAKRGERLSETRGAEQKLNEAFENERGKGGW